MNQKELTKTIMMISNWNKLFGLQDLYKINSALYGLNDKTYLYLWKIVVFQIFDYR